MNTVNTDLTDLLDVYYTTDMVNESCKKQFVHPAPLYIPQYVHFSCKKPV